MPFQTDDPNMLVDWLTVGSAARLDSTSAAHPHHERLLGASVALWRDEAGMPHASLDEQPLTVQQRYDYLWVCPSGAPARPLFAFPEYHEPGRRIVDCSGIGVATSGLRVVENFLDMGHFPFVHPGYLGEVPHTEVAPYHVDIDAQTQEIWAVDCRFWQPRTSATSTEGIDAAYRYRVMQPLSAMLYKSCVPRPDALDAIGLFVQPADEEHVIAHCLLVYFDDVLSDAALIGFQQTIFGQDKPILENHVPKRMPLEGRSETSTRCDVMSATYRRWLKARGMHFGVHPAA